MEAFNEACDFHQHEGGSMVEPSRQNEPHAHSVTVSPGNNQLIVCDLGLDKVLVYDIDHDGGKLVLNEGASVDSPPGGGPSTLRFPPERRERVRHQRDRTNDQLLRRRSRDGRFDGDALGRHGAA